MVSHSGLITVMQRAARKAARGIGATFGEVEQLQVSRKGPAWTSWSTRPSGRNAPGLKNSSTGPPRLGLVLEEGEAIHGDPMKPPGRRSPIDGTSNFLHGSPHFSISFAGQEPEARWAGWGELNSGLIYQPMTDESFWAEKGRAPGCTTAAARLIAAQSR
jgi:myo-inositol-1(or 4)-monophosphatase